MNTRGHRVLLAGLLLVSASLVQAQDSTAGRSAVLRTSASASRMVKPNQGRFTVQFSADGNSARQAGSRVAARADSIRRAFMALGVPRDSLVTGSTWYWWSERIQVAVHPRMTFVTGVHSVSYQQQALDTVIHADGSIEMRPAFDTTYTCREIIELRVGDIARIGALIDTALSFGVREISGITYSSSDTRTAQLAAMRDATTRAREQADAIATASGQKVGRLLYLGTEPEQPSAGYSSYDSGVTLLSARSSGAMATEISAPPIAVTVTVYTRWQLLDR